MKKQTGIILSVALFCAILWSCTKNDGILSNVSMKQAVNQSALDLNNAMFAISSSKAYSILTINPGIQKSVTADSAYRVNIPLDSIKGVYEYKPQSHMDRWGMPLVHFFQKTGTSDQMIVKMPFKKIQSPGSLRHFWPADSTMKNNFSIAVSDYHNNYNSFWDYDYLLASEISIDSVVAGNLNIKSVVNHETGINYASQYAFNGSYTAGYKYVSGDTTVSSFTITGDNKVLYEEKLLTVRNDTARFGREHEYILTIGDVQIIRKSGTKDAEIFVNGVLQPNAVIKIVDKEEDKEASVCKKRDVQITFEDGTTTTISALIGNSVTDIKTLFNSLHQVYFAAYIVDWIAYDIYYKRN